jgi:ABC-type phosphate transport system substrate-binding protein
MVPANRAAGDEIDVIVNKTNGVSDLPITEVRKLFLGDKSTWPNGKRVTVVMLAPGSPERGAVLREIYKMTEGDYAKYFLQAAFTGRVQAPPKDASPPAQAKQLVVENPGAVAYLKSEDVDDSVKVVLKIQ